MKENETQLKCCPFCGGDEIIQNNKGYKNEYNECKSCQAYGPDKHDGRTWNDRQSIFTEINPKDETTWPQKTGKNLLAEYCGEGLYGYVCSDGVFWFSVGSHHKGAPLKDGSVTRFAYIEDILKN